MKIFSSHRRKLEPHRRFGGREFRQKLTAAKNYKRSLNPNTDKGFFSNLLTKTGLSNAAVATIVIIFAGIFYFLVFSPYFLVSDISVSGNNQVSSDQISSIIKNASSRFFLVKKNNFFLLTNSSVNKMIVSQEPLIASVKSVRSWPNKLSVNVTERKPALSLDEGGKHYLIDDQGFIVKEINDAGNLLKVKDQVDEQISPGEYIDGKIIPFIISMEQDWPRKLTQPISYVKIPGKGATEVEFVANEGWSVFFSTDRSVTSQTSNLALLLNKQIGSGRSNLAYIDLRLAKWAYYCLKSTPCQQTDQEALASQANPTTTTTTATKTAGDTIEKPDVTTKP